MDLRLLIVVLFFGVCSCDDEAELDPPVILPRLPVARYSNNDTIAWFPRIIGGSPANNGEFPGMISLQTRGGAHICGATLLDWNRVLTAAHCVTDENTGRVLDANLYRVMADDLSLILPGPNRQIRNISHIYVHLNYSIYTFANDIAVLRLATGFSSSSTGSLRHVPRINRPLLPGEKCHLAGWGAVVEEGRASPILQRVTVEVIDINVCNGTKSFNGLIPKGSFCAGRLEGGFDSCQGDSGGALMCHSLISGIVSFGYGCGRPRFPGVYVDVHSQNEWIDGILSFEDDVEVFESTVVPNPHGNSSAVISSSVFVTLLAAIISNLLKQINC